MEHHLISAQHLSIDRIREILFRRLPLALSDDARARIVRCREYLDRKMENPERPVYGITTGFGSLCDISVGYDELAQLQKNLVMSHACGTGERVPSEIVKLILLLKIQSLSYGHSGVQLATVERLIDFFNNDVLPVVYQQGSLGASGDLAPLAHMSLPLLGLGEVECEGRVRPAAEVLAERLRDINPTLELHVVDKYIKDEETDLLLDSARFDYAVDAIDTLSPKLALILGALKRGIPLVSSMGAGAKTDPTRLEIEDISRTHHCPLAHMLRKRLHKAGVRSGFKAVFSAEPVREGATILCEEQNKKSNTGTISYLPALFGIGCASVVVRGVIGEL